jgi:hypothetical protein
MLGAMDMTDQTSSATKAGEIAQKIVAILVNENSETRQKAMGAAMVLLGENPVQNIEQPGDSQIDIGKFFNRNEDLKPSDYAQLCAAYHFAIYGTAGFSLEDLRTIARDAGVVLPDRLDKTLVQAVRKGKKLFQTSGKGLFKPTATAGLVFKEQWDIRPGRTHKSTPTTNG